MVALPIAPVPVKRGVPWVVMLSPKVPVSSAAKRLMFPSARDWLATTGMLSLTAKLMLVPLLLTLPAASRCLATSA